MLLNHANDTWSELLLDIMQDGLSVKPRGMATKELLAHQTIWNMMAPVVTLPARRLGYKFMIAESIWILSGRNDVGFISKYSKEISKFSDNGHTFFGAYGPKVRDQLGHVHKALSADPDSRQAVINIWRENPPPSSDIPCTISLQWCIRDDELHCIATMRSSDAWLGVPYDVVNFSHISAYLCIWLRSQYPTLTLGRLYLTAGSQHLYQRNWAQVEEVLQFKQKPPIDYLPLYVEDFPEGEPDQLTCHLTAMLEGVDWDRGWLVDLFREVERERAANESN